MNTLLVAPQLLTLCRESLARSVSQLPSLPAVVTQLMDLMQRQDVSLEQVSTTLSLDQALSARVLQLANSPFYGVSGRVHSIRDGVSILGLRQLGTLVLAAVLSAQFEHLHGRALRLDEFWRHAIACAVAARALAQSQGMDPAMAFTAGLLHDVGRLVLDQQHPAEMSQAVAWAQAHDLSHEETESELLAVSHSEVGGWVADHWRLPVSVVAAIQGHHQPPASAQLSLTDLVHVANAIAHALDLAGASDEAVPLMNPGSWARLGLRPTDLPPLLQQIEQEFQELRAVLRPSQETP